MQNTVNIQLAEIALERVEGTSFEKFFHAFYPALAGIDFVPLGGNQDGGADAFQGETLFEGKGQRNPRFYQASVQKDHRAKILYTVQRIRDFGRDPQSLLYFTSRIIKTIDREEEILSNDLGVVIQIRDRKWIVNNINHSPQTVAAFESYLRPCLSFLDGFGGATTTGNSPNIASRTLCVFLGQEVDRRKGNTDLLDAVTDSLILWALEDTDPDANKFMVRGEILTKIETTLPSAKHFIRGVFKHRIEKLSAKDNPSGREVRWHKKDDKFCLTYKTRQLVTQENIKDESLKQTVMDLYMERAARILDDGEALSPDLLPPLVHKALELTFERGGLELANFLTDEQDDVGNVAISDHVDEVIEKDGLIGADAVRAKEVALAILREAFYRSTEKEREYYGKLSRTYTLMLTLRNEPRIVEYFKGMSSNFVLFVGSDIITRALSERYLAEEDQMTVNMLRILREAGSMLILTHATVEEVHSHVEITDYEFQNCFQHLEPHVHKDMARHASKILLRAYLYVRIDPLLKKRPTGWKTYIGQVCNYDDLHKTILARNQVKHYLVEKFGFEYLDKDDVGKLVGADEAQSLAEQIKSIKSEDVLARNDARHILAVYGKRKALGEEHRPNPYGYRTWWLTHETRVLQCTQELTKSRGSKYIIRPEFVLNFVALSPTTEMVRKSYATIFPTLLGIKLSNRLREDVFQDVMCRANKMSLVDEARAKVMLGDMSNRLKGDNYKTYEAELLADRFSTQ